RQPASRDQKRKGDPVEDRSPQPGRTICCYCIHKHLIVSRIKTNHPPTSQKIDLGKLRLHYRHTACQANAREKLWKCPFARQTFVGNGTNVVTTNPKPKNLL